METINPAWGIRRRYAGKRNWPIGWLLKIKLTAVIVMIGIIHGNAYGYAQKVSISGKNLPLTAVFSLFEKQTGMSFFFNAALLRGVGPVSIELKDVPLETALQICLRDTGLDFYQAGKTIFIVKKEAPAKPVGDGISIEEKAGDVHGRVINEQGESMAGATVTIQGTKHATLTNDRGEFELRNVAPGSVLEVTFLGYQNKLVQVEAEKPVIVRMILATNKLDEAQVIAYGKTSQRLSTGDVSTVGAADIAKQPVGNPLLALEGRAPGLFIAQSNGLAGSGITVQILGQNSLAQGNAPLYVVDGVPYPAQLIGTINGVQGGGALPFLPGGGSNPSPFNFINPGDIESISVLKDADATAIYGSRAANGAILISTKKGRAGKTSVNLNIQEGIGNDVRRLNLLNRSQYLQMRREAFKNDGLGKYGATDYDVNGTYDTTKSTDWQKALLGGNAQYTDVQGDVSGGTTNIQVLVGAAYHRETTVFPTDLGDQKGSVHFNLKDISTDQRFTIQFSGNYLYDNNRLPTTDLTQIALALAPDAPSLRNSDGSLNWAPNSAGISTWANPLANFYIKNGIRVNNLVSNALVGYKLFSGFEVRTSLGYTNLTTNETYRASKLANAPENQAAATRNSYFQNNNINSWIVEPQAEYKVLLFDGELQTVIGTTFHQNNSFGQYLIASGFNSDQQEGDIAAASSLIGRTLAPNIYKYNAFFGRLNYNWQNQLIINIAARRDGSSRFGTNNQFHNFGSVGAAWIFSKIGLLQKMLPLLSFGKLSASYGTTGNDQIGDYTYLTLYTAPSSIATPYQSLTGLQPKNLSNPYLQWEETRKLRAGLDIGLFKDRILASANYFLNRSSNELISYTLPLLTGFSSIMRNFPAVVQNSGWELTLTTINFKGKSFSWTSNFNLTIPKNKLVSFPGLSSSSYASSLVIGKPITLQKKYRFVGVDPLTGVYEVADAHGNPTLSPSFSTDRTVTVDPSLRYYGGIQNTLGYKGLQLDIFIQFTKQVMYNDYGTIGSNPGYFSPSNYPAGNQPSFVLARWQKQGDNSSIQRYSTQTLQSGLALSSNLVYTDGSYARIKNLSLSWQLPEGWKKRARVQSCRIYAQGQNLFTITRYKGLDPETGSSITLPPLRVITAGLQIGL